MKRIIGIDNQKVIADKSSFYCEQGLGDVVEGCDPSWNLCRSK
jgi:hypothetical protein